MGWVEVGGMSAFAYIFSNQFKLYFQVYNSLQRIAGLIATSSLCVFQLIAMAIFMCIGVGLAVYAVLNCLKEEDSPEAQQSDGNKGQRGHRQTADDDDSQALPMQRM